MYNYEKKKTFDELAQEFQFVGERNSKLPSLAWACKREKLDEEQAKQKIYAVYDAYDIGHGRSADVMRQHHDEIDRAVAKAYDGEYTPSHDSPQAMKTIKADKAKLTEFHDKINAEEWKKKIIEWEGNGTSESNGDILWSLFRNCKSGYVAYYGDKKETLWLEVANEFEKYEGLGKYFTLCTFKEKTKRTGENMDCQAVVVIEIDHPHNWDGREWNELSLEEQKHRRGENLDDTCRLLTELGISPTAVTFSGTKSWHVAFRLAKPVPKADMEKNKALVMEALEIIGADPSMISAARSSRIPCKFPMACKSEERASRQHVVYWDADAEVDYEKLVERLVAVAEKINGGKIRELPNMAKFCPYQFVEITDDDGNISKKLVWKSELWEPMLRELGIFKIHRDGNPCYILQDKKGVYREISLDEIGDYVLNEIGKYNMFVKAKMREKRDVSQPKWYVGVDGKLNLLKDTKECVSIPFRDCMAEITKSGIKATTGYGGHSIPMNSPTLWHNFSITDETSEFEVFLRHACGELEDNPEWEKRFAAFKCLAGYFISQYKEPVNWMCVITDESVNENDGGTGKSIFMTGISKVVEAEYRDERNKTKDMVRFEDCDYSPTRHVLWRDEVPKGYDWSASFGEATGMKVIEQKGKNKKIKLTMDNIPKLCYCTNYYPTGLGASFERRIKRYELSNHYQSKTCTPSDEFGHILFTDWDNDEWNRFYNFMCGCVQFYLQCDCNLIDSGSRYGAEKTENANVPDDFIQWFEEEIADKVEEAGEYKLNCGDVEKRYCEWYKNRYGMFLKTPPSRIKRNSWIRLLSSNRHIIAEIKAVKEEGKAVKKWCFEKLPSNAVTNSDGSIEILVTSENLGDDDKNSYQKPCDGESSATQSNSNGNSQVPNFQCDGGGGCHVTNSFSSLKEKEKENIERKTACACAHARTCETLEQDDFFGKAPDAPYTVIDNDKQIYELHFRGKKPKPDEQMFSPNGTTDIYKVDGYDIQIKDDKPLGRWKIFVDEV